LCEGRPVPVGARAFDLLVTLIEGRHRLIGKRELMDRVWPGLVVEESNLQVQVSGLRKILGPNVIATVPGLGYRFERRVRLLQPRFAITHATRRAAIQLCAALSGSPLALEMVQQVDPPRYCLLDTTRLYAAEQLAA
jgi:DNA-binding winged helix-turn-helix (wHTH) protein